MELLLPGDPDPLAAPPGTPEAAPRAGAERAVREPNAEGEAAAVGRGDSWGATRRRSSAPAPEMHRAKSSLQGPRAPCRLPLLGCARAGAPGKGLGEAPRNRWFEPAPGAARIGQRRGKGRAGAPQRRLRGGGAALAAQIARLPLGCRDRLRCGTLVASHGSSACECPPGEAASAAASARRRPGPPGPRVRRGAGPGGREARRARLPPALGAGGRSRRLLQANRGAGETRKGWRNSAPGGRRNPCRGNPYHR